MVETKEGGAKFLGGRKGLLVGAGAVILLCVVAAPVLLLAFVGQPVRMLGAGMSPALDDGDRVFVSKMVGELRRGDIVIFYHPLDSSKSYIKRVVGLPGETLALRGGKTFVNGQPLEEPYLDPRLNEAPGDYEPVRLRADEYFVMGDNRDNSADSRHLGPVHKSRIYGKVAGRYWPLR